MQLSPHFSLAELTVSEWAKANGVSNQPDSDLHWRNLRRLATELEAVREVLGNNPIIITSAYRNRRVNAAVGGVPNSAHAEGLACDFTCPRFGDVTAVCKAINEARHLHFDQLIWEYGRWTHIGYRDRILSQRRQLLTKRTLNGGYSPGIPN